jgi:hypothetical protein
MNRLTRSIALAAIGLAALPRLAQGEGPFLDGRWGGAVNFGTYGPEGLVLRLFPADPETGAPEGGLVDMPARGIFGFPLGFMERNSDGLSYSFRGAVKGDGRDGAFFDGLFELKAPAAPAVPSEGGAIAGTARISAEGEGGRKPVSEGSFELVLTQGSSRGLELGNDCRIDTGRGLLPGSFLLPGLGLSEAVPVVLLLSGADADRDGNNYSVPGRSDSLAELAVALRERGIASLRFDQRGTGEAYRLVASEEELRFDDRIDDARAAIRLLATDPRFSSVTIVGMGQGALVGACAVSDAFAEAEAPIAPASLRLRGVLALCASGLTELESAEKALSNVPEAAKAEAEAILSALKSGTVYPNPSPYFADYFRPSVQPYLAGLFARDIRAAFGSLRVPALVVAGGSDLQVKLGETELLAGANPAAAYRIVPGMSHALKAVGDDVEANYASFTDPELPLAAALADLVASFARGGSLPGLDPRLAPDVRSQGGENQPQGAPEGLAR